MIKQYFIGPTVDCNVLARAGTKYQCDDRTRCVNASRVCDGSNDCLDWSDETNCGGCATCVLDNL